MGPETERVRVLHEREEKEIKMPCCRKCWEKEHGTKAQVIGTALMNPLGMPMIVCSVCGNKRCPHATDHELQCTGSNESGQVGSIY